MNAAGKSGVAFVSDLVKVFTDHKNIMSTYLDNTQECYDNLAHTQELVYRCARHLCD